jgi:hypothetical protein
VIEGWKFFRRPLKHWRLQAAINQRPIVFAPEGLPLDRCITLNRRIRVERFVKDHWLSGYIATTLLLIFLSSCSVPPPSALVQARPFEIESKEHERTEFAGLTLLSAFELRSRHPHFGGISGLSVGADGRLYAVSDRGYWLSARMRHDSEGRLLNLLDWVIKPILTPERTPTDGLLTDAEALASAPDGSFIVAFEQVHRLWRYPPPPLTFDSPAQPITMPRALAKAPRNGGLECIAVLPDGRIFTIAEEFRNRDGSFRGWLIDKGSSVELSYVPSAEFRASDCAALPNGDVIVLERHFSIFLSFSARLKRISGESIRPHAVLSGEELLRLDPPLRLDNFEGIAVREDPAGTLIYLISDDNFQPFQRTLLLQFRLPRTDY